MDFEAFWPVYVNPNKIGFTSCNILGFPAVSCANLHGLPGEPTMRILKTVQAHYPFQEKAGQWLKFARLL